MTNPATPTLTDEDRWSIHDLHAAYVISLDLDDVEAVAALFLEDGTFETHHRVVVGAEGWRKMLRHAPKGMHLGGHAVVWPAEYGATARQQLVFVDTTDHSMRLAIYDDEIVRTDDGWRFRRRRCRFMGSDGALHENP
jgi:hypothetical protein